MKKNLISCIFAILLFNLVHAAASQADDAGVDVTKPPGRYQIDSDGKIYLSKASSTADQPAESALNSVQLSLMDAIRYSLEGNQDIQVVSFTPKQSLEELTNAESVYDPSIFADSSFRREPNLQSSVTNVVMEDTGLFQTGIKKPFSTGGSLSAFLEMRYGDLINAEFDRTYKYIFAPTLEVRQPLLKNIGAREEKAAITIANFQASISEEEFRQKVIEIATRVSRVYWQLYLFREEVTVNRQNLDMAEEVYRREAVRLSQGISQKLDAERARSNAEARRSTMLRSKERFRVAMDQLKLLLNRSNLTIDSDTQVIPVEPPKMTYMEIDEAAIIETALKYRSEVKNAEQQLKIQQVEETLSRHQRLPNLDFFGRYSLSGYGRDMSGAVDNMSLNDEDAWAVGLNFDYPIGNRSAKSVYRKKSLERKQADAQIERLQNQIKMDVKQVILALYYAKSEMESTRIAKEAAERVVAGEFARFDIGQTTNEELLRAQDLLAATSRSFNRALVDYNIAMAELVRAQGILPDGVAMEDARR